MQPKSDAQLLRDYAEHGIEAAFTELVHRHTNLVYSVAFRQVESTAVAADISQAVFLGLVRGAPTLLPRLAPEASLAGWLCRSACNLSLNHRRDEFRRHARESQVMEQLIATVPGETPDWDRLRHILDETMAALDETDYDALVLRFYQNQDFRTVGAAIGVSDDTAQKRVSRALEKLRDLLSQRGIRTTAAGLGVTISANAIQAAPVGLASTISATALGSAAVTTAALTVTKTIAMTTLQKVAITTVIAVLVGTGLYEAHQAAQLRSQNQSLRQQLSPLEAQLAQVQNERVDLSNRLATIASQTQSLPGTSSELLKLRAEVTRLRIDNQALASQAATDTNDPDANEMRTWLAAVKKLKQEATDNPKARIPEFSLLTEQDWLNAAKLYQRRPQLSPQVDLRVAMAELRQTAKNNFADLAQEALGRYIKDHNGQFPQDLSQFQSYLPTAVNDQPVDPTILDRYKIIPATEAHMESAGQDWVLIQKELTDPEYDHIIAIGTQSWSYRQSAADSAPPEVRSLISILDPVLKKYATDNNGQPPANPFQLQPYLETDQQKAAFQKMIELRNASSAVINQW